MSVPGASREEKAAARAENKAGRSVGQDSGGESEQAERGSTERLPHGGGMPMKGERWQQTTYNVRKSRYRTPKRKKDIQILYEVGYSNGLQQVECSARAKL